MTCASCSTPGCGCPDLYWLGIVRAAPAQFPYPTHRNMAEVMDDEREAG